MSRMSRSPSREDSREDTISLVSEDEVEVVLWDRVTVKRTRMFDLLSEDD